MFGAKSQVVARPEREGCSRPTLRPPVNDGVVTARASVPREELVGTEGQVILSDRLLARDLVPARNLSEPESGKVEEAVLNASLCSRLPLTAGAGISLGSWYPGYPFQGTSMAVSIAGRGRERFLWCFQCKMHPGTVIILLGDANT